MKRLIILLILLLCVTGCGKTPSDVEPVDSPATTSIPTVETTVDTSEVPDNPIPSTAEATSVPVGETNVNSEAEEVYNTIEKLIEETKNELSEENKIGYQISVNYVDISALTQGPGFLVSCLFVEDNIVYRYYDYHADSNNVEFDEKLDTTPWYKVEDMYEFKPGKITVREAIKIGLDYMNFEFEDLKAIDICELADATRSYYEVILTSSSEYCVNVDAETGEVFEYWDNAPKE